MKRVALLADGDPAKEVPGFHPGVAGGRFSGGGRLTSHTFGGYRFASRYNHVFRHAQLSLEEKVLRARSRPVFPGAGFATPWRIFDLVELPPGEVAESPDGDCEQGFVVLKGEALFEGNEGIAEIRETAAVVAAGASRLRAAARSCTAMSIGVALPEASPAGHLRIDSVDAGKLKRRALHSRRGW